MIAYRDDFDVYSVGDLPTGWTALTGTWKVHNGNVVSSPRGFGQTSPVDGNRAVFTGFTAIADQRVVCRQRINADSAGKGFYVSPALRVKSDGADGYFFITQAETGGLIFIYKRVGGAFTNLGNGAHGLTLADGDQVWQKCEVIGTTIRSKIWKVGTAEPAGWHVTLTDSSVSAAGYIGTYSTARTAGGTGTVSIDDIYVDDMVAGVSVAVNNANVFPSPYNWYVNGSTSMLTTNPGAYVKLGFTGKSITATIDVSKLVTGAVTASKWPRIRWSVDGGGWHEMQLTKGDASNVLTLPLAGGLADTTHQLELYMVSNAGDIDGWTNQYASLVITGFTVDTGKASAAPTLRTKRAIFFGDSITEGAWAMGPHGDLSLYQDYQDALNGWPSILAQTLDCEYGICADGGHNWNNGGGRGTPTLATSYSLIVSGQSRLTNGLFSPAPDYVFINEGANGDVAAATIQPIINNIRAAAGSSAKIVVIVAFNQTGKANLTTAFYAVRDSRMFLCDLGTIADMASGLPSRFSPDGLHPSRDHGSPRLASMIVNQSLVPMATSRTRVQTIGMI